MRRIGLALLAAAGCNQVFGIKDTDVLPDAAPPMFTGHMNWIAPGDGSGSAVEFPIGGEAVDVGGLSLKIGSGAGSGTDDSLAPTTYDDMTGTFALPFKLAGEAWRLLYTLPNDPIENEWQWSVQSPNLVIPRMTRKGAMAIPTGSGYDIQPTPSTTFTAPAIATGGAFTYNYVPNGEFTGNHITYNHADHAQALFGPVAAPDPAKDWIFIEDTGSCTGTEQCVLGWAVAQPTAANPAPLVANMLTPLTPTWHANGRINIAPNPAQTTAQGLLKAALNQLAVDDSNNPLTPYGHMTYGLTPSTAIYDYRPAPADCGRPTGDVTLKGVDCLASPALIPLADDSVLEQQLQVPDVSSALPLTPLLYARVTMPRTVHGVVLASAIQSLVIAPMVPTPGEDIEILTSTIAGAVLVDSMRLDTTDLSGATGPVSMDVPVNKGDQPRLLTFNPRLGMDGALQARADDYVVTLWQIQNPDSGVATLHTMRVYHVLDASHGVYIEGQLLQPGLYVFSVTTRIGFPMAAMGDYSVIKYPLAESTVFSRQFRVQ